MRRSSRRSNSGFTLLELGIVLVVVALISAGAISLLRLQTERAQFFETRSQLEEARAALISYAVASGGKLPCPSEPLRASVASDDAYGLSRPSCDTSTTRRGLIPWKDLGISGRDAWGNYLAYEMTSAFKDGPGIGSDQYGMDTNGTTKLRDGAGGNAVVTDNSVAAAIWSHGANGNLAITAQGLQQAANASSADESANSPTATANQIVVRPHSTEDAEGGPYDDQVVWLSRFILYQRVQAAGICIPLQKSNGTYPCS
jgi:prepilin-type N-terminal cleavage/methylation domain-containing protein